MDILHLVDISQKPCCECTCGGCTIEKPANIPNCMAWKGTEYKNNYRHIKRNYYIDNLRDLVLSKNNGDHYVYTYDQTTHKRAAAKSRRDSDKSIYCKQCLKVEFPEFNQHKIAKVLDIWYKNPVKGLPVKKYVVNVLGKN